MKNAAFVALTAGATLITGLMLPVRPADAGMFDFMNPGEWFGRDRDRYYGGYGPYGRYGPYGWGGPYGYGGGPWGYGGPYGAYGPYGWGPGYGRSNTIVVTPGGGTEDKSPPRLPE